LATTLKRLLVGRAKRTEQAIHERLTKKTGLAVFASDALSSTAYASEEILLVLAVAYAYGQTSAFNYVVPITLVIAVVLTIVAISYRQTIHAYPSGGGAYIVAKENLGTSAGLVAAAALLAAMTGAAAAAGAFAVGSCGAYGYGYDFRNASDARTAALKKCAGSTCKIVGVYPVTKYFGSPNKEAMYTTLLMSTGLTFGTISSLFGLSHGIIDQGQYSALVAAVIASAVIPTVIANAFYLPRHLLPEPEPETKPTADAQTAQLHSVSGKVE